MCELELVFPSKNNELDAVEYRKEHFIIGEVW